MLVADIVNIYKTDVLDIVDNYDPYANPAWRAVMDGGVPELLRYAESQCLDADISDCRSACGICRNIMTALKNRTVK